MIKDVIEFVVLGEPASKANSRQLVHIKGKPAFIKSKKARDYSDKFTLQCPQLDPVMEGDLKVSITIHYASRRPDLDESVILDCMQSIVRRDKKTKQVAKVEHHEKQDRNSTQYGKRIFWGEIQATGDLVKPL